MDTGVPRACSNPDASTSELVRSEGRVFLLSICEIALASRQFMYCMNLIATIFWLP